MKVKVAERSKVYELRPGDTFNFEYTFVEARDTGEFFDVRLLTELRLTIIAEYFLEGDPVGTG